MIWPTHQLDPLLLSTLKVIFNVPNSKYVERYLKRWERLYKLSQKTSDPAVKEGISFDVAKLNKMVQAEWFRGTIYCDPDVPFEYSDKWNLFRIKYYSV
jgi:hypothetical protein